MTDEDFIFDVVSHPFDPSYREVYSDWLEDHGDPRAKFLRLQAKFREVEPFSEEYRALVKEEKKANFHKIIDEAWWEKMRQLTTPLPPVDVTEKVPQLADYRRSVIRLHPQEVRHEVDPRFSKVGGQFLWPAHETWPVSERGVPLVPILQLRSWDFPELEFPAGQDVLQLFWTPQDEDDTFMQPIPSVFCRRAADVTGPLAEMPDLDEAMSALGLEFDDNEFEQDRNIPYPCGVYPERIVEFPGLDEVYNLRDVIKHHYGQEPIDHDDPFPDYPYPDYHHHLARCPGWTLGSCKGLSRNDDDRPWQALGTLGACEYEYNEAPRWEPLEVRDDRTPGFNVGNTVDAPGLEFGRHQDLIVWVCFDGKLPKVEIAVCEL